MKINKQARQRVIQALIFTAIIVLAVVQIPSFISSIANTKKTNASGTTAAKPAATQSQTGAINKEQLTARLKELDATIKSLKPQIAASPGNLRLVTQLNAAITESESITAQLGGDRVGFEGPAPTIPNGPKEQKTARLNELAALIATIKSKPPLSTEAKAQLAQAEAEYSTLSAQMGGDGGKVQSPNGGPAHIVPSAPTGCTITNSTFTNSTPVAVPTGPGVVTSTIVVSGAGSYLWDIDLQTFLQHTFAADLDVTITSPAGTVVTLTTDNGGSNDNVFDGTVWDDQSNAAGQVPYTANEGLVTDHTYANLTLASPLTPEEPLSAFRGEDPNGTWTITISDDLAGDGGSLNSWSVLLASLPAAPTETTTSVTNNTPVAIPTGPGVVTSTVVVAGAGASISKITLQTNMQHTFSADLDVTIQSPSGRVVTLTTDNGGSNDNVFDGTLWNDDADPAGQVPYTANEGLVTDHTYANLTLASPLTPEEPLGAFAGEDPNGTWTITISDDLAGDGGSLNSWTLNVTTAACGGSGPCVPPAAQTFSNNTPTTIPTGPAVVTSTIVVSGAGPSLYDVNVTTFLQHTFSADLDVTITSPAGTVVTLTTDNGGSNDNVFDGTLWNDDADPAGQVPYTANEGLVTDHTYANLTLASPLTPEEPLAAFRGEDPNGTWTITISDDLAGDGGSLNSWSLSISSLPAAPTATTTSYTQNTPTTIPTGPAVVTSTVVVAGAGTQVGKITLLTNMQHTFSADLDVTITSPAGTVVTLTTDNGGSNDNVFNGTLWDDDANPGGQVPYTSNNGMVTDQTYANLVTATPLTPEEPLGAFVGEDPNGTWTITISDDLAGDGGSLDSWTLNVTTTVCGSAVVPCVVTCPANVTQSNDPNQCGAVVTYPAPTSTGDCGPITCTPPSGSFFPVGATTVTCSAAEDRAAVPSGACTPQTLTQSSSQAIEALNSVSCNNGVGHTNNSYFRAFTLSSFGVTGAFDVQSIDIGIETASSGGVAATGTTKGGTPPASGTGKTGASKKSISKKTGGSRPAGGGQSITVRIYTSSSPFPTGFPGSLTQIGTATVNVADQSGTILNVPITGTAPANSQLVVEVFTPNGEAAGNLFFIGSNTAAQTGPSYLLAADCGVTTPTDTAAIGFPDMHIVLNVNGCAQGGGGGTGPSCTFTVTVNDTQPPVITCPANVTAVTPICAGTTAVVNYPPPTASDNCPGVTTACVPPSGSTFPIGVTTVTCTATDASGNTATCSFTVTTFNACIQDDNNPNIVLLWNTQTGSYRFCCNGTTYTGTGLVQNKGNSHTINHSPTDRRINGVLDCSTSKGQGGLQSAAGTLICAINDRDTRNNTCNCGSTPVAAGATK